LWRRCEGPRGRPKPASRDETPTRRAEGSRRHQSHSGSRPHSRGREVPADRGDDADERPERFRSHSCALSDPLRRRVRDCGSPRAEHGDGRWKRVAWGSRERPPGLHARPWSPLCRPRPGRIAVDRGTRILSGHVRHRTRVERNPPGNRDPEGPAGSGQRVCEAREADRRFPIVGVAANLVLATKGTIESAGLALTAVGPTALKATEAERHLVGKAPDDAAFERAAELAQEITSPVSDLRGPAEYKRAMVRVLTLRALHRASARARGGA